VKTKPRVNCVNKAAQKETSRRLPALPGKKQQPVRKKKSE